LPVESYGVYGDIILLQRSECAEYIEPFLMKLNILKKNSKYAHLFQFEFQQYSVLLDFQA
jgi:tRNA G37 N-methylase Trm5